MMNQVKGCFLGLGLMVLAMMVAGILPAKAEEKPSAEFTLDVMSKYIWRGYELSDSAVIQPGMNISYQGMSVSFWGNLDLGEWAGADDDAVAWSETDFTVGYTYDKLPYGLALDVGTIYYDCQASDTVELYAGISGTIPTGGIDLGMTVYRDIEDLPGLVFELSAGKSFALPVEKTSLDVGATMYYMLPDSGDSYLNNLDMSVSAGYEISKNLSVSATLAYSLALSDEAKDTGVEDSILYGGVGLSFAF